MGYERKTSMSITSSRIINMARDAFDEEMTFEEFTNIMFVLGSYEECGWNEEALGNKAKKLQSTLSPYAKNQLDLAIREGMKMYLNYGTMVDKFNIKNKGKGKKKDDTPSKDTPVPTKKEKPKETNDSDFWWDAFSGELMMNPDAANEVVSAGFKIEDVAGYLEANRNTFDLPFNPYSIEDVIEMYKEHQKQMKRQYPAAPSRGK